MPAAADLQEPNSQRRLSKVQARSSTHAILLLLVRCQPRLPSVCAAVCAPALVLVVAHAAGALRTQHAASWQAISRTSTLVRATALTPSLQKLMVPCECVRLVSRASLGIRVALLLFALQCAVDPPKGERMPRMVQHGTRATDIPSTKLRAA
jgi:hypothetical protein